MEDRDEAEGLASGMDAEPRRNLFERAYEAIEERLVNCTLPPGYHLTMNDLTALTGLGRTPVHHAVNRLAADTLILIRPRHGLQIAPIDLARERTLLRLRRDLERFVVRLAAERSGPAERDQIGWIARLLEERRSRLTLDTFNNIDRGIDRLILAAANEPFLESALRPLHTIFRRIGYIHHTHGGGTIDLTETVDHHLAVLDGIAARDADRAIAASDGLIAYVDAMFDSMESRVARHILDSSIGPPPN